jgi:glutathione S-transferase kappa 1
MLRRSEATLTRKPQRCMVYIKETFSKEKYEAAFLELWVSMWEEQNDISKPEKMAEALARHFTPEDVKNIMASASTPEYKQKLNDNTQRALDKGAFGAPWFWVRNHQGEEEPFFGSDR